MKKTDKIELRVDHAEKERLSAIAERRGQTVSDVVRDALAGELGVARATYPKWPGQVAIGAALASALSLVSLLPGITSGTNGSSVTPLYPTSTSAHIYTLGETLSFGIPMLTSSERDVTLLTEDGKTIRLSLKTTPNLDTHILTIVSDGCIIKDTECDAFDIQTVTLEMRPAQRASASVQKTIGSEILSINFSADTFWPKPVLTK